MKQNPQAANNQFDNGNPTITPQIIAHFKSGMKDEYLGPPYWI